MHTRRAAVAAGRQNRVAGRDLRTSQPTASGTRGAVVELERRHLWSPVLRGAVAIVFGLLALLWPGVTVVVLALLVGAYIVVEGVATIITGFRRARDAAQRTAYLLAGLIGVVTG